MLKRSKTTVSRPPRKGSSASYKAYYGITLIETLMSVGLLGVILIPLLMTSTAYLSTKLLNNRTNAELSQNVNALGAKLNTLAASTTGVNPLASSATNLEMQVKAATGARRIYQYSIIGAPGAQRLREFQGSTGNVTSTAAMRSLNEDSITLVGNTGFVYCNETTCTVPTNSTAQNQAIARTAEMVVFDGNTATDVVRVGSGIVTGAEPVALLFNAGDNGRKRGFLPSNILSLGTDPIVAQAGFQPSPDVSNTELAHTGTTTNQTPFGLVKVVTKQQAYGTPIGGGAVDADLRLATGSDSSFTALPLANAVPAIPADLPVAPLTTQTSRTNFSRIYKEGPGTAATGNIRTILPNFQLDQTVADSFQGNMCFSGNRGLDNAFQVYYWNRTMSQAALTSVQNATTPFASTPECVGASGGYNNDANAGTYYAKSYPRRYWAQPQTYNEYGFTQIHEGINGWVEHARKIWNRSKNSHYQWYAFNETEGYRDPNWNDAVPPGRRYFYTDAKVGSLKRSILRALQMRRAAIIHYFYTDESDYGNMVKPVFANPTTIATNTVVMQDQYQTTDQVGFSTLIHRQGNPSGAIDVSVDVLDPYIHNHKRVPHERGNRKFNIYGTEGGNRSGDKTSCNFTQDDPAIRASGFAVDIPFGNVNNRPVKYLTCSDLHYRHNIQYLQPPYCKVTYERNPIINPTWTQLPQARMQDFKIQGTVSGNTFTLDHYWLDIDGEGLDEFYNDEFYLDGNAAHAQWAGFASSQTNSSTLVGSTHSIYSIRDNWVDGSDFNYGDSCFTDPNRQYIFPVYNYDSEGNAYHANDGEGTYYYTKIKCNANVDDYGTPITPSINKSGDILMYNNLNNIGAASDSDQWFHAEQLDGDDSSSWIVHMGTQDAWFVNSTATQAYISECNIPQTPLFATVTVDGTYYNDNFGPQVNGPDTINSTSLTPPYVIRDNVENYLFYNQVRVEDGTTTNRLYGFNPITQKVVAGPTVNNLDWSDVATARLAAGKRVLSYSPHNKVAVTGTTSGYGNVSAWYYDSVDQPVAKLKTGGVGFNTAQANSTNVNYIADPTSTFNAYQTNLTAVTSEGSTLYTLNSVTGTLTRYVTPIGQYNHVRQSETILTDGIVNASSAIAVSPMDDGLYLLDAGNKTVRYYADRRMGDVATTTAVATLGAKLGSTAGAYAKILSNNMRDFETLLDSRVPPPFDDVATFGELQACVNSCTNPIVKEAAQYFVNNKAAVFTPMESMTDPVPNEMFNMNDLNAYVAQQNLLGLSTTQTTVTIPTQGVARSFSTSQATLPTGLAVSKATGLVYVLDSTLGTVTVGTTVTRTLNIHVYNPNGTFIETLAFNVTDDQFVNAADRLVPQNGQIMRLTLGEKQSQFYVHVENNGRIYQFGVERQI